MSAVRVVLVGVTALSLATFAHLVNAVAGRPSETARLSAQVSWLSAAVEQGAPERMQALFPEGAFFTGLLTGLGAARAEDRAALETAARVVDQPGIKAGFGVIPELDGGIFYRGWRLLLLTEQSRLSGDVTGLADEARTVGAALAADPDGVPRSYPSGRWPCDAVVAMAAVIGAYEAAGEAIPAGLLPDWQAKLNRLRDPATALLPHRIAPDRPHDEPPRGTSQSIIQAFWPTIDPAGSADQWRRYVDLFVVREAGLVGVREHLSAGPADEDSGPLILGVSLSATAVTLGAARANGDLILARSLDREAEAFGLPLQWSGQRRFALGMLPVGDAWVAWARSVPVRREVAQPASSAPAPLWAPWLAVPVAVGAGAAASAVRLRPRPAAPPDRSA